MFLLKKRGGGEEGKKLRVIATIQLTFFIAKFPSFAITGRTDQSSCVFLVSECFGPVVSSC